MCRRSAQLLWSFAVRIENSSTDRYICKSIHMYICIYIYICRYKYVCMYTWTFEALRPHQHCRPTMTQQRRRKTQQSKNEERRKSLMWINFRPAAPWPIYIYIYMHIDIYIYVYIYIQEHRGPGHSYPNWGGISGSRGTFFDLGGLCIEKTARSLPPCDGPSWAGSNTAIESFWRCIFAEI